jgi:hypothetical protein
VVNAEIVRDISYFALAVFIFIGHKVAFSEFIAEITLNQ